MDCSKALAKSRILTMHSDWSYSRGHSRHGSLFPDPLFIRLDAKSQKEREKRYLCRTSFLKYEAETGTEFPEGGKENGIQTEVSV